VTNLELFKRLLPDDQAAFFVVWWESIHRKPDGKFRHDSAAFRTLLELAHAADQYASALNVRNVYFCVSAQREANFCKRNNPPQAIRNIVNTVAIKVLFLDLDVKSGAYETTDEAMRALIGVCIALGLPTPSIAIYSSAPPDDFPPVDSSLHCYWVLNRSLSVQEWQPLARAFKTVLQKHGLIFDLNVPTNAACILRPLGSLNRKYDPPRITRLAFSGPDCDLDAVRAALAHVRPEPEREHSQVRGGESDFAEVVDVVEFLTGRGYFGRRRYAEIMSLHFAAANLITAKPELVDDAWDLIRCVVAATGRDLAINESRFNDALTRTADRLASDDALTTPASLFGAAYGAGWRRANALGPDQRTALAHARRRLRIIFGEGHDRAAAARQATRLVERIRDPRVGSELAPSMARRLARDGCPESEILSVIEGLSGRPDVGLVRWAMRRRSEA
jgi:hypothetical protein